MRVPGVPEGLLRPATLVGLTGLLLVSSSMAAPPPERVALTNCRIIPVVGETIDKGTILVDQGKIAKVGKDVEIPYDARVFDLSGKTVFPGCIVAHTYRGLDSANESRPIAPQLDAADAVDPSQLFFEDCLRLGVTTVHVIFGNNTVIGGLGRVVRPIGRSVAEISVCDGRFLKLSVTPRGGEDRMTQLAQIREAFMELSDALIRAAETRYEASLKDQKKEVDVGPAEARKRGAPLLRAEDIEEPYRNLLRLRGGVAKVGETTGPTLFEPLGAFVYCGFATDVAAAVRISTEYGFKDRLVLVVGGETYKAAKELKEAGRPVILPPDLFYREADPITGEIRETFIAKALHDAGVVFSLTPGFDDSLAERMLTYQAAVCIRNGIPRQTALESITINPAKALGLENKLGSIEVGKDANLVVYSGDPLDFNSVVERTFVDGIPAYDRTKDIRIQKLLSAVSEAQAESKKK